MDKIVTQLAQAIAAKPQQVQAAIELLDGGASVPFIARYRKEATAGLDDVQLRELQTQLVYLRELEERRQSVLRSIQAQGKLSDGLRQRLEAAATKQELEDLYLPYKPKRKTKGLVALEAGLEPLAQAIWQDPAQDPMALASAHLSAASDGGLALREAGFGDAAAMLNGVRDLLCERWAEDAHVLRSLREWLWESASLCARLSVGKPAQDPQVAKFEDYFAYHERVKQVPSHRALAVFRGRALELLDVRLLAADELPGWIAAAPATPGERASAATPASVEAPARLAKLLGWQHQARAGDAFIARCIEWAWSVKLSLSLERDILARLRNVAETQAIDVFAKNLRDLLMAAPAGKRVVMGLDPGIRTGVKVAVVDETGRVQATHTVYPHEPRKDWAGSLETLVSLCLRHGVNLVATGNGTASRETDRLAAEVLERLRSRQPGAQIERLVVSESGASVYSASEVASAELPDLDVSLRGAVSIARRVQDPLAELVKIDPKSIGVGQYQHDVNPAELSRALDAVVEDCVNAVGVDLNTASISLLRRVSGLGPALASGIVRWRDTNGAFDTRAQLLQVHGMGAKTFQQSAGFLRIPGGSVALDRSGVHPETYEVVERVLQRTGHTVDALLGNTDILRQLSAQWFACERFGIVTVSDVLKELEKPGRDPRPGFVVARFNDGVESLSDLKVGMVLQGTVSNVAQFGAFVDVGVHQDGLIHVSQLADRFVQDAREVVKAGDVVQVRVLELDLSRQRISLSMRSQNSSASAALAASAGSGASGAPSPASHVSAASRGHAQGRAKPAARPGAGAQTAMSAAFDKLKR